MEQRQSAFFFLVCSFSCERSNACCNPERLELAISAGAEVLDYGRGWKQMWSPEPLFLAVQSLDQRIIVLPLGECVGIRGDSEIELGRCHGRGVVSQAHSWIGGLMARPSVDILLMRFDSVPLRKAIIAARQGRTRSFRRSSGIRSRLVRDSFKVFFERLFRVRTNQTARGRRN